MTRAIPLITADGQPLKNNGTTNGGKGVAKVEIP